MSDIIPDLLEPLQSYQFGSGSVVPITSELFVFFQIMVYVAITMTILAVGVIASNPELRIRFTLQDYRIFTMKLRSGGLKDFFVPVGKIKEGFWVNKDGAYAIVDENFEYRSGRMGGRRLWGFLIEGNPMMFKPSAMISEELTLPEFTDGMAKKRVKSNLRQKWIGSLGTDWLALLAVVGAIGALGMTGLLWWQFQDFVNMQYLDNEFVKEGLNNLTRVISNGGGGLVDGNNNGGRAIIPSIFGLGIGWVIAFNGRFPYMRSGKTVSAVRCAYNDKLGDNFAVWSCNIPDLKFADWIVDNPKDLTVNNVLKWKEEYKGITVIVAELATWFNSYNFKAESSQEFGLFVQQTMKGNVHLLYDTIRPNHGIKRLRDLTHYFVFCDRVHIIDGKPVTALVEDYSAYLRNDWTVPIGQEGSEFRTVYGELIHASDYSQYFDFFDTWRMAKTEN